MWVVIWNEVFSGELFSFVLSPSVSVSFEELLEFCSRSPPFMESGSRMNLE